MATNCVKMESKNDQNGVIQPLLTDLYQITMAYSYWKSEKRSDNAVFDLFFRKNPFKGEFTIFAGLEECLKFLKNFKYSENDIEYLKTILPDTVENEFLDYMRYLDASEVTVYALEEGSVVFPKVPLLRLEGPLPIVQLLETTLLNLVNYASLVATNAARLRIAAGYDKSLLEFGLRRAQGPDGGLSASRYCYIGGFDGTSNVLAGKLFGIPVKGTHAHAYVTSFIDTSEIKKPNLKSADGMIELDMVVRCKENLVKVSEILEVMSSEANLGELAAFISYAIAFPAQFLCLLDTYDVIRSGIPNYCAVSLTLHELGYKAQGVRLDSGDLAYLSVMTRKAFRKIGKVLEIEWFHEMQIVASNDINEDTIHSLNQQKVILDKITSQGHAIDSFGIGTHLVTCQKQPALGCVYKLVEINDQPRIKLSEEAEKITLPGKKELYRLYGADGGALVDLLTLPNEAPPNPGSRVLCRHPFHEAKRAYVIPSRVDKLYKCFWKDGKVQEEMPEINELRDKASASLKELRFDHKRSLNPTPYKVSVTDQLYSFIHELWLQNAPIGELS